MFHMSILSVTIRKYMANGWVEVVGEVCMCKCASIIPTNQKASRAIGIREFHGIRFDQSQPLKGSQSKYAVTIS